MLQWWDSLCNGIFDAALGWLLGWSWTATLVVVAAATGVVLALVRRVATNQDLLRRADEDRRTLKRLAREARARGDREAVRRMRTTKSMVALRVMPQESLPLLLSILPIALLATWAFNRLGYLPPEGGEQVEVVFYAPVSAVGEAVHLVPEDGLSAGQWVRPIELGDVQGQPSGIARWTVSAPAREQPHRLTFRFRGTSFQRDLLVGRPTYAPPLVADETGEIGAETKLREARLLGLIPGLGEFFPPWLVAYLILVIPLAVVIKRVLKVY